MSTACMCTSSIINDCISIAFMNTSLWTLSIGLLLASTVFIALLVSFLINKLALFFRSSALSTRYGASTRTTWSGSRKRPTWTRISTVSQIVTVTAIHRDRTRASTLCCYVFFLIWTCKKPADCGPQQHKNSWKSVIFSYLTMNNIVRILHLLQKHQIRSKNWFVALC